MNKGLGYKITARDVAAFLGVFTFTHLTTLPFSPPSP
jgi:hypothetical protein